MSQRGVGQVLEGKYEILASIGKGGMSDVWLARDRRLEKLWAIKEIKPNVAGPQGTANRQAIIDEANFMKRLDHPAIPRVVDIIDTGSSIYVAMDYINGRPLDKVMRQQGKPFDQEMVIDWGIQLCDVLGYLHGMCPPNGYPVVYRDMKPSNVMLRDDGLVKLIDFGIAMELLPSGPSDHRVIGTGGYGAPEQVDPVAHKATPVDTRADVYALGATLYSLVTGHTPRTLTDAEGKRIVDFRMLPIREWDPHLSDGLERIILRATQESPDDRYQTMEELCYDLRHYEELTQEYRAIQQAKVDRFRKQLGAACISLVVGLACLAGSSYLRATSFDALMHEASVAGTEERGLEASEAEEELSRAIALAPGRIEPYQQLLKVYQTDLVFSTRESERWLRLWQRYGRGLEDCDRYARLCFDVGNLYLCFYDYLDLGGNRDGSDAIYPARGQGAIQNAARATEWFRRAKEAGERDHAHFVGPAGSGRLTESEYDALGVFETIGSFHETFAMQSVQGKDVSVEAKAFWDSLKRVVLGTSDDAPLVDGAEYMVQLRLFQVAFESLRSPTYLSAMRRGGVSESEAATLLERVHGRLTDPDFISWADATSDISGPTYREIVDGYGDATDTIRRIYHGPTARGMASTPVVGDAA